MKTRLLIGLLGLLIIASSCSKEEFPDRETLVGKWALKDGPSEAFIEFGMWRMTITNGNTQEYHYSPLNSTMYLYPNKYDDPDDFSTHAIYYNKKKDELRIWHILKEYGDSSGYTTFKRQ